MYLNYLCAIENTVTNLNDKDVIYGNVIFPNPVESELQIKLPLVVESCKVEIYN